MRTREGENANSNRGILRTAFAVASWGVLGGAAGQLLELAFPGWVPAHWVIAGVGTVSAALAGVGAIRAYHRNPVGATLASQLREANRFFKNGQLSKREYEHLREAIIRNHCL